MEYIERDLFLELKKWLERREILSIKGPRQSGKTTILKMLSKYLIEELKIDKENVIFMTFEDRDNLEKFTLDPKGFTGSFIKNRQKYYFLIDEAHYCKDIGQRLKLLYDLNENIKFIITGSSSLELTNETAKYLVGRVFSFELLPFKFGEYLKFKNPHLSGIFLEKNRKVREMLEGKNLDIPKTDIFIPDLLRLLEDYIIYGGYPEAAKSENPEEREIILKNIYDTYVEKDIVSFLQISDTIKFKKIVSTLSATTGNLLSYESLTQSSSAYFRETTHLLDILEQTYIIRLLRPFHKNLVTELKKSPKVYFYDTGLRNYAIRNFNSLDIRPDSGALAENFALNELSPFGQINFWRTTLKSEVDFVLNGQIPIEIKFQSFKKANVPVSLRSFIETYSPKRAIVATKDFWGEEIIDGTTVTFVPIVYL